MSDNGLAETVDNARKTGRGLLHWLVFIALFATAIAIAAKYFQIPVPYLDLASWRILWSALAGEVVMLVIIVLIRQNHGDPEATS